ncbi:MAG TPA: BON domain-containing protein [Candidatus Acidoferrales bacterium]|nr:BON domain-containing protein [Candidatus Acidoferrales bacterium]
MTGSRKAVRVSLLMLGMLAACAAPMRSASESERPRDRSKYQAWLAKQVRHKLVMLPYYSVFDNMEFKIEDEKVILLGQVVRPSLKSDAEASVKKIEGVRGVINRMEVLPLSPNDDRIRRAVFRAIYSEPALQRYGLPAVPSIHIIVKHGHVTLEGVTANETDRNIANIRANEVPGVFSVTNHLRVEKGA